ncbi:MAG: ClbS/DfsB family four-helix bundle protein [Anaerolineae bacterium]|jgi:hypothetical protein|nr:ClbS/DfsB family four-helix bundle protein [Anaerolineae bacterium]
MTSREQLLTDIHHGWQTIQAFIGTFSSEQLTGPTDAAGWTAKDHLIHLAIWEQGILALLKGESRPAAMGIDPATWDTADYDRINAIIQQAHHDRPLPDVLGYWRAVHEQLIAQIETLTDAQLDQPYHTFNAGPEHEQPITVWIINNTYEHYAEHHPWIAALISA